VFPTTATSVWNAVQISVLQISLISVEDCLRFARVGEWAMCRFRLQAEVRQRRRSLYEYAMRKRILVTNPASTARVLVDVVF